MQGSPCSCGSGGRRFEAPADPGQSPDEGRGGEIPEALEIPRLTLAKNAKNTPSWSIYTKLQFC